VWRVLGVIDCSLGDGSVLDLEKATAGVIKPEFNILIPEFKGESAMIVKTFTPKFLALTLIATLSMAVQAGGGMSEEQMQHMMEQAQKMQECMARIDQSGLDALAARADAMEKEVKALCDAGKRDQAQKLAIKYGREISASPEMQALQKCGEMAQGMMQQMPMMSDLGQEYDDQHVCDGM
jgi:hypothetical protein